jgi:U3 small nucleolar RNA-associated protein 11
LIAAAGAGGAPPNRHTVFVDDSEAAEAFSPADYFNTDPDLVGRAFNRPRMETLEGGGVPLAAAQGLDGKERARAKRARERSYAELEARLERSTKMAKLGETIDRDREMLKKGRRVKVRAPKGAGGDDGEDGDGKKKAPAVFKWKAERKR